MKIDISFVVNILTHCLILLIILSIFFWRFVSKKENKVLTNELETEIDDIFIDTKKKLNENQKQIFNDFTSQHLDEINVIKNYYQHGSKLVKTENKDLLIFNFIFIGILILMIITIMFTSYFTCKYKINFVSILKENIGTFIFLGAIEFIFFKYIASEYVPVKPSFMSQNLFKYLNKNL
jgi:hypothetical protein